MPNWGAAGSGAASGAAAGSVFGPWGTAIGGAAGGLYGLLSGGGGGPVALTDAANWTLPSQQLKDQKAAAIASNAAEGDKIKSTLMGMATDAQNRQAPTIAGTQLAVDQTGRQGVLDTAQRLGGIASGQQAGAGELAVNRQIGQATAQQMAAARMAHGANAALALRNMMRLNADTRFAGAGAAAQAQMQDQQAANAQLGSLYGNLYGADIGVAGQNAQLGQSAQVANQQAALQQRGMNDALQVQALGQLLGWDQQTINAHLAQIQQQRANQEGPNTGAALLQGAGNLLPLLAKLWGQRNTISAPTDPDGLMKPGG